MYFLLLLPIVSSVAVVTASPTLFEQFKIQYDKQYDSIIEENKAFITFSNNIHNYTILNSTKFRDGNCNEELSVSSTFLGDCVPVTGKNLFRQVTCSIDGTSFNEKYFSDTKCTADVSQGIFHTNQCLENNGYTFSQFTCVKGSKPSWSGITQFSDLTTDEFKQKYMMKQIKYNPVASPNYDYNLKLEKKIIASLPSSIDWVQRGAVTEIKNQGQCGSCWVFAATGALEGARAIASNLTTLVSLSEEEYLACYGKDYSVCNGGDFIEAFLYAKKNAICKESAYPYIAPTGKPYPPPPKLHCNASNCSHLDAVGIPLGDVLGYVRVVPKSEANLMKAVAVGPVSVSVDGGALQLYSGGIMEGQCMTAQHGDHAMLVVGYGSVNGTNYWKIKNSYGKMFGIHGYMLLKRNDSLCGPTGGMGILSDPGYPLVN